MSRRVQAVAGVRRAAFFSRQPAFLRQSESVIVALIGLPLAVVAAITLFELANWDKITPRVTALGTSVGGLSRTEAVSRLKPGVEQLLDRPLEIVAVDAGQTWHTTARALGMRLDPNELVDGAYRVGRDGSPLERLGDQLGTLTRGRSVSLTSTTDVAALDGALAAMAHQVERPPADARLSLSEAGAVQSSAAQAGLSVDAGASRERITAALNGGSPSVALVTHAVPPAISDEQLQSARGQLDRLLGPNAEPLTLTTADKSWRLEQSDVVKLVRLSGGTKPGEPAVVNVDDKALRSWAGKVAKDVDQAIQDARFAFNGGSLKVVRPSKQGRVLDQEALVHTVHDALLGSERALVLPVTTVEPRVSSDDPAALGITELIDRGSTSFNGSIAEKKHNIQLAAERLNGIVVPPGGTFSFNAAVGPTTLDSGFQWGFAIAAGNEGPRTVPSVAGGICQVATTLFQPVFWAGYQLEERFWHMYWIPAYTSRGVVGLDVTVDSDSGLDFKWTNTTANYILIQSATDEANIYFGLYGKKPPWKVQVDEAIITKRTPPDPKPIAQAEPTLPWGRTLLVETARDGFDAEVIRHVIPQDGTKPRDLDLKSTYQPSRTVTLVGSSGKPTGASIDDAIQRVLDAQKPAEAKPSPTPAADANANAAPPGATPAAQAQPTGAAKPAATPTPAPRNGSSGPTPKPTSHPANSSGIAPTPTPGH